MEFRLKTRNLIDWRGYGHFLRKTHVLIMNYFPTATYLYRIIKNIQDYTMPSKTRVVGGQYSSPIRAIAQRGIIQSKSIPELWDLTYKVILWPWLCVWSFKATAYTVSEKRPCTERFNQNQRRHGRQRRGDYISDPILWIGELKINNFQWLYDCKCKNVMEKAIAVNTKIYTNS